MDFTLWDILRNLLLAARWTILLSIAAFVGGGIVGILILLARISRRKRLARAASIYIATFQGTLVSTNSSVPSLTKWASDSRLFDTPGNAISVQACSFNPILASF